MKTQNTLITIQDEYIETINLGIERWSHRKDGGHASRIARGARTVATKRLNRIGFTDQRQIDQILRDARDMAALIRNSEDA
jgi:hypothetical protein